MNRYARNPFNQTIGMKNESIAWDILYERYSEQFDHNTVSEEYLPYGIPSPEDAISYVRIKHDEQMERKRIMNSKLSPIEKINLCRDRDYVYQEKIRNIGLRGECK